MKVLSILAIAGGLVFAGCDNKAAPGNGNQGGTSTAVFTATLLPANEVPAINNAENTGSGNVTVTVNITRDASNTITAATATFQVNVSGFPSTTNFTIAHIHEGNSTVANGPIKVNTTLASGEVVLVNGAASFTKANINVPLDVAQAMLDNPAGYYFNVHTQLNGGGVARGQLTKTQG